jgi:histidine triad (HIT) family protein
MCLFCKVARHEAPAKILFEQDELLAFHDIHPQAPTHVLVIPRKHLGSLDDGGDEDTVLLGKLLRAAREVAHASGIARKGYRVVVNTGADGGQSVGHLHVHVLGGRPMRWPPG